MVVEDRPVDDADRREELGVLHEKEQGLSIGELVDRERMSPPDPIAAVSADDDEDEQYPAEDLQWFLHCTRLIAMSVLTCASELQAPVRSVDPADTRAFA